jgi:hypothetical protein
VPPAIVPATAFVLRHPAITAAIIGPLNQRRQRLDTAGTLRRR